MRVISAQLGYRLFRTFGRPVILPFSYTISVTAHCNYRCATCRLWSREMSELSREEYSRLFTSLGRSPYWATFSGGEPFLREDFVGIVDDFCRLCRPKIVNIPTNGSLPEVVRDSMKTLTGAHRGINFIVNVSIDSTGDEQGRIRGNRDAYLHAVETLGLLKALKAPNLITGIGTVISRANIKNFSRDREEILRLGADSAVAEIAEEREELDNKGTGVTPDAESYKPIADLLIAEIDKEKKKGWARVAQSFRRQYYAYVYQIMKGAPGLKCYAGWASVQIMPDGEVWACCVKGDRMGNVRDFGFDFRKLWRSLLAGQVRESIKKRKCSCPLANAAYTNMMLNARASLKVLLNLLFNRSL